MTALAVLGGPPVRTRPFLPWPCYDRAEIDAVTGVLASRRWGGIYHGSQCEAFETELCAYTGSPYAIAVSNGTAGLMIALKALGIGAGDEVIVPAMTYIATATAVTLVGGTPVFADIDPVTHTLASCSVRDAITGHTRAIIAVHLGGHPADMDALSDIATAHGLPVVEDCAHSLGATWQHAHTGLLGAIGVFSFAPTKNITAGEGGAIVTFNERLAARSASLRDHGRPPGTASGHPELGWNLRLTEFQAAILRVQLTRLDGQLDRKNVAAAELAASVADIPGLSVIPASTDPRVTRHARYSFAFMVDPLAYGGIPTSAFRASLRAEGIPVGTRDLTACPDEPLYSDPASIDFSISRTASALCARTACTRLVLLGQPAGSGLLLDEPAELLDVHRALLKIYENRAQLRNIDIP
jgi:dTDP-4-amino-4,6-dideoxygalactose transaminase